MRSRDSKSPKRAASFMFLGPTGVGKTALSKYLAEIEGLNFIKFNMGEFTDEHSGSKLIGAPPGYVGYDDAGTLTEQVRRNPNSVVLFDEIEKAHPKVLNILLSLLDDGGMVRDSFGRLVNFTNATIVMTSNIFGRELVEPPHEFGFTAKEAELPPIKDQKADADKELQKILTPEFYNRIGKVVVFNPLDRKSAGEIVDGMIAEIKRDHARDVAVEVSPEAREFLIGRGYSAQYGARNMRRTVENEFEDPLIDEILKDDHPSRLRVVVSPNGEGLRFEAF
jgi:ATP-dependent Clp protease ATP-binding subunit ClpC